MKRQHKELNIRGVGVRGYRKGYAAKVQDAVKSAYEENASLATITSPDGTEKSVKLPEWLTNLIPFSDRRERASMEQREREIDAQLIQMISIMEKPMVKKWDSIATLYGTLRGFVTDFYEFFEDMRTYAPEVWEEWDLPETVYREIVDIMDTTIIPLNSIVTRFNEVESLMVELHTLSVKALNASPAQDLDVEPAAASIRKYKPAIYNAYEKLPESSKLKQEAINEQKLYNFLKNMLIHAEEVKTRFKDLADIVYGGEPTEENVQAVIDAFRFAFDGGPNKEWENYRKGKFGINDLESISLIGEAIDHVGMMPMERRGDSHPYYESAIIAIENGVNALDRDIEEQRRRLDEIQKEIRSELIKLNAPKATFNAQDLFDLLDEMQIEASKTLDEINDNKTTFNELSELNKEWKNLVSAYDRNFRGNLPTPSKLVEYITGGIYSVNIAINKDLVYAEVVSQLMSGIQSINWALDVIEREYLS